MLEPKKIKSIPIVIGALGTVCKDINDYLKTISPNIEFRTVQKTALLGTAYILRNFLTPLKNSKPSGTAWYNMSPHLEPQTK